MRLLVLSFFVLSLMCGFAAPTGWIVVASAKDRTERVAFAPGRSARTVRDTIIGYDGIRYLVSVRGGQRLSASLRTNNPSSYFNIQARGASQALFNGSIEGNLGDVIVPSSGDYVIQVYLMRNATRRAARFHLILPTD